MGSEQDHEDNAECVSRRGFLAALGSAAGASASVARLVTAATRRLPQDPGDLTARPF
jgi:hypothetical protein